MEVVWLILTALIFLAVCITYWRKHSLKLKRFFRKSQRDLGLQPLVIPSPSLIKEYNFSELKSQLEELARLGWAKNETAWHTKFSLSSSDLTRAIAPAQVVEVLLAHAARVAPEFNVPQMVPRIVVEPTPFAAGQFEVDEEGWVTIKVSPDFYADRLAAQAILAHEACHYILENTGIRQPNFELNERYTDLCMFICGFGEIFLAGYKREPAQHQYRSGHRLGYLADAEYQFANQYVVELRESYQSNLQSELDVKRKQLRQLVHGDEATLKRLIEYERRRSPDKSEAALYQDAIDRLQRGR